jgi:hypothetical protein
VEHTAICDPSVIPDFSLVIYSTDQKLGFETSRATRKRDRSIAPIALKV